MRDNEGAEEHLVTVGVRVPVDLHRQVIEALKADHFASISEYVRDLMRENIRARVAKSAAVEFQPPTPEVQP